MVTGFVSVLLPYKNAAATLGAALSGLLERADPDLEVLATDDGSTDASLRITQEWAARDARVKPLKSAGSGLVSALNTALAEARGGLIARMDADDLTHPERIAKLRSRLMHRPDLSVLGCQVEAFCDAAAEVGEGLTRYVAWQNSLLSPEDHARELFIESPLCHPSVMLRREALAQLCGYRELGTPEDYDLWLRCDAAGLRMAKLNERLLRWRHTPGRATFADARYSPASFRRAKAPFLAARLKSTGQAGYIMWGAGPTGRRMARELEAHGMQTLRFIDIDPQKLGRCARGVPIEGPETLRAGQAPVVVAVGARGARALIRPELLRRGFAESQDVWFAA